MKTLDAEGVKGRVARIIKRYDDGEFVIARFIPTNGERVTILGPLYGIQPDDNLVIWGTIQKHPRFGSQIKVTRWEKPIPTQKDQVVEFLSSSIVKGCGQSRAKAIVKEIGENAISEILNKGPEVLLQIKGIGPAQAKQIHDSLAEHLEVQQVVMGLLPLGLSTKMALRAYRLWGRAALDLIRENPYRLTDLPQIGFEKADALAMNMGISPESRERVQAAVIHMLSTAANSGHCFLSNDDLCEKTLGLLDTPTLLPEAVTSAINALATHHRVVREGQRVYLSRIHEAEKILAYKISQFFHTKSAPINRIRQYIEEYEEFAGLKLAPGQVEAVEQLFQRRFLILTGGPGTGKTKTVQAVLDVFPRLFPGAKVALCSPTGRASQNMAELTGMDAYTIHRLMGIQPGGQSNHSAHNPLPYDLLVVDEGSMADIFLSATFFDAIDPKRTSVLILGDTDQLPAVGPGNVLHDLIEAGVPTVRLTHIFRQAQESQIVINAHLVNEGKHIIADHAKNDFYFLRYEEPAIIAQVIQASVEKMLAAGYSPEEIIVLSPMKKTDIGTKALNSLLQQTINPPAQNKAEVVVGKTVFRVGDKVIQNRNNYDKECFNGDIGVIESIKYEEDVVTVQVRIRNTVVYYSRADMDELELAYCVTVHKSQGGEYPIVIMPVSTAHYIMLTRNLLYTAITRAKQKVILIGTDKALALAIRNNKLSTRNTTLRERILLYRQKTA